MSVPPPSPTLPICSWIWPRLSPLPIAWNGTAHSWLVSNTSTPTRSSSRSDWVAKIAASLAMSSFEAPLAAPMLAEWSMISSIVTWERSGRGGGVMLTGRACSSGVSL